MTKDSKVTQITTAESRKSASVKGVSTPLQTTAASDAWQKRIGAAKKLWGKLSESELKTSAGEPAKLAQLVQQRYAISRPDADKQVKTFIENRQSQ